MSKGNQKFNQMLDVLNKHSVVWMLNGGYAIQLVHDNYTTTDVDILADDTRLNLERLWDALRELEAKIYIRGRGEFELPDDPYALAERAVWNFICPLGRLDVMTMVSSTKKTFQDLRGRAVILDVDGTEILSSSLDDVLESKRLADRQKDRDFFEKYGDDHGIS